MSVVLITGASTGFGRLAAISFARHGDTVFASMRDPGKGAALPGEAGSGAGSISVIPLDVTSQASVDAAVARVRSDAGRIDVLVNNAGLGIHGPVEECDDDEIERVFATNVYGLVRVTRAVAPQMRAQGGGTIINVSSVAGKVAAPFSGIYSASKHAVEALSDALHYELHPFGVRVVAVEPGGFETQFGVNRIVARRFGEGSPYAQLERRFAASSERLPGAGERTPAQAVADIIVEAAHAEAPKRRYLAGADAVAVVGFHKQLSDEDFEKAMRTTLDFWD